MSAPQDPTHPKAFDADKSGEDVEGHVAEAQAVSDDSGASEEDTEGQLRANTDQDPSDVTLPEDDVEGHRRHFF